MDTIPAFPIMAWPPGPQAWPRRYTMSGVTVNGLNNVVRTTVPVTNVASRSYSTANMVVITAAGMDDCRTAA